LNAWTPPPLVPRKAKENAGIGADVARTAVFLVEEAVRGGSDRVVEPDWSDGLEHAPASKTNPIEIADTRLETRRTPAS
jgi:hypothetical protein